MIKQLKTTTVLLALALVGGSNQAWSQNATLTVWDGVNPLLSLTDNAIGDYNPAAGAVLFVGNIGVWNLVVTSAATKPALGTAGDPVSDITVQASSSAAGSLRVTFSDNNFTAPSPGVLNGSFSGIVFSGSASVASYQVYGDPANIVGATTVPIVNLGVFSVPNYQTLNGVFNLPATFSLTQVLTLTSSGPTGVSVDASLSSVPEPGSVGLVLLGIGALAASRRKKSRA